VILASQNPAQPKPRGSEPLRNRVHDNCAAFEQGLDRSRTIIEKSVHVVEDNMESFVSYQSYEFIPFTVGWRDTTRISGEVEDGTNVARAVLGDETLDITDEIL
jgi:hypothetical protein